MIQKAIELLLADSEGADMIGNMFLHWLLYHCGMHGARTQTTHSERELLRTLAQGKTCVVELGVYEGVRAPGFFAEAARFIRGGNFRRVG